MAKKIILLLAFCSYICVANNYSNADFNGAISASLRAEIGKAVAPITITKDNVEAICKGYIKRLYPNFDTACLHLQNAFLKRNQWYVHFGQTAGGLEIVNSKVKFRIFKNGNLMDIETNLFDNISFESVDIIDSNQIKLSVLSAIERPNDADLDFKFNGKYIYPIKKPNTTIYKVVEKIEVGNNIGTIGYGIFIDIATGLVLEKHNFIMNGEFKAKSMVYTFPDEPMVETTKFPYLRAVTLSDETELFADSNGLFTTLTDLNGEGVMINFSNFSDTISDTTSWGFPTDRERPYIKMRCMEYIPEIMLRTDYELAVYSEINNNEVLLKYGEDWSEQTDSIFEFMATHYHYTFYMHDEFKKIDSEFDYLSRGLDFTFLVYNSQNPDSMRYSNASSGGVPITFYNIFTTSSMKFAQSPGTLYHELGHSVNRFLYQDCGSPMGMLNGALNEGLADVHAAYLRNTPEMDYMPNRTLDNDLKLGVNEQNQVHADGRIFSGAMWSFKKLTSLELMGELMHYTRFAAPDAPSRNHHCRIAYSNWLKEMLLTDDDDGILTNLTPHFNEIIEAFYKHNITLSLYAQLNYTHEPIQDNNDTTNPYQLELTIPFINQFIPFDSVLITYTVNGRIQPVVLMERDSDDIEKYVGFIPPQSKGSLITYRFDIVDPYIKNANNRVYLSQHNNSDYSFIIDFDTIYANFGSDDTDIKTSEFPTNSVGWRMDKPSEQSDTIKTFAPTEDFNGDGYCFMVTDHRGQAEHLEAATIIFPFVKMSPAKMAVIQLHYFYYLNIFSSEHNYGTLDFSISSNNIVWANMKTIRWIDVANDSGNENWKKLTINIHDRFQNFDSVGLRIRAMRGPADPSRLFGMAAYIDDIMFKSGDSINKVGIQNFELTDFNVFPNPANNISFVSFTNLTDGNVEIVLLDALGKEIRNVYNGFVDAGDVSIGVDISALNSGIYFVRIKQGTTITTQKLVVR